MRKVALAVLSTVIISLPVLAQGADEDWDVGPEGGYFWPRADVKEFFPDYFYGADLHYWMNDTSTLDVFINQISASMDLPVYEEGEESDEEELSYDTTMIAAGFRYIPELDIFFSPYLGLGLGFQMWNLRCDLLEERNGNSIMYYAIAGGEYPLTARLRLGLWSRYVHIPFNERLDTEIYIDPSGEVDTEREDLEASEFFMFGVNLSFKVN